MKIRRITATPINFPLEAPYSWVFGELPGFTQTIVEVETDDGLLGLGDASGAGAATLINDTFAPRLVGLDPFDIAGAEFRCLPFWAGVQSINDQGRIAAFSAGLEEMLLAMQQTSAVGLPGDRRLQARARQLHAITVPSELVALLTRYGEQGSPMAHP